MQNFGSQVWDCSLAVQALHAGNINDEIGPVLKKAHEFLKLSQVREDPPDRLKHFRDISKFGKKGMTLGMTKIYPCFVPRMGVTLKS